METSNTTEQNTCDTDGQGAERPPLVACAKAREKGKVQGQ